MLPVQDRISRRDFELYYREGVNGWIYSMLNETDIHDQQTPVKFCFSSLRGFEPGDTELRNDRWIKDKRTGKKYPRPYYFLISTPRKDVAYFLSKHLIDLLDNNRIINLKDTQFRLVGVNLMKTKIVPGKTYSSDGPVIFKIDDEEEMYDFFKKHLIRKYRSLGKEGIYEVDDLSKYLSFEQDRSKKIIVNLFKMKDQRFYKASGYKIKLTISKDAPEDYLNAYRLVFDSGIGSYTAFGCGFINVK